jgi:hypothetical protein
VSLIAPTDGLRIMYILREYKIVLSNLVNPIKENRIGSLLLLQFPKSMMTFALGSAGVN